MTETVREPAAPSSPGLELLRTLAPAPLAPAQQFNILIARVLQGSGVQLAIRRDMRAWSDCVLRLAGNDGVNPTFDPDQHADIGPDNAFWIELTDREGRSVACIAHRMFETADFPELMRSMKLWMPQVTFMQEQQLCLPADMPRLAGRVGHGGGLVVDRTHRGRGYSWILPRVGRAVACRLFGIDWYTSLEMGKIYDRGYCAVYGNAHTALAVDGWFQPRQMEARVYLSYMSAAEMSAQQSVDVRMLIDHDCHDLVDLSRLTGERQREAPVVVKAVA